jgi:glutamine synthetase
VNANPDTTFDDIERHIKADNIELVRFAFCDQHGLFRCKTLTAKHAIEVMRAGVPMVGTLLLKDTASRTAFPTFDPNAFGALVDANPALSVFANASDVVMRPDPTTFHVLPWTPNTAWIQCQAHDHEGNLLAFDTRGQLQRALTRLASHGYGMRCGLEVEFHIYKLDHANLAPEDSSWPAPPPNVTMIHPGNNVLCEQWADTSDASMRIVLATAQALDLPIRSLEVELGPSQVEVVFDVQDALAAADSMALFRNAVKQALRRAGYHATFMCRPQFPNIVSSGWHLHQSLYDLKGGVNAFSVDSDVALESPSPLAGPARSAQDAATAAVPSKARDELKFTEGAANAAGEGAASQHAQGGSSIHLPPHPNPLPRGERGRYDASGHLSSIGSRWLAGLLAHARASCAFAVPTINGYARYQPNMMAPQRAIWGVGSRGAALRVVSNGKANEAAARIENRLGEPAANPYLYIASQIHAGLDGIKRKLQPPPAALESYAIQDDDALPTSLAQSLDASNADDALRAGFGESFVHYYSHIKRHELARYEIAHREKKETNDWEQREYFSLF